MKIGEIITGHEQEIEIDLYPDVGEITDEEELEADEILEVLYADSASLEDAGDGLDIAIIEYNSVNSLHDAIHTELEKEPEKELTPTTMASIRNTLYIICRNNDIVLPKEKQITKLSYDRNDLKTSNQITLAGIGDALKSLWEKIKSGLKALWKSIKNFWRKHISSLGIMKKKIKKMGKKVTKMKGSIDSTKNINTPSSLSKSMAFKGDITVKGILNLINLHIETTKKSIKFSGQAAEQMNKIAKSNDTREDKSLNFDKVGDDEGKSDKPIELGSEQEPLATGFYGFVEVEDKGDEENAPIYKFTKESTDEFNSDDRKTQNDGQKQLLTLLQTLRELYEVTVDLGKDFDKQNDKFDRAANEIEHVIRDSPEEIKANTVKTKDTPTKEILDGVDKDEDNEKGADKTSKAKQLTIAFRSVASTLPSVNSKMSSLNLKLMKETLKYVKLCLKNYIRVGD